LIHFKSRFVYFQTSGPLNTEFDSIAIFYHSNQGIAPAIGAAYASEYNSIEIAGDTLQNQLKSLQQQKVVNQRQALQVNSYH
jgi:hypothetical protein